MLCVSWGKARAQEAHPLSCELDTDGLPNPGRLSEVCFGSIPELCSMHLRAAWRFNGKHEHLSNRFAMSGSTTARAVQPAFLYTIWPDRISQGFEYARTAFVSLLLVQIDTPSKSIDSKPHLSSPPPLPALGSFICFYFFLRRSRTHARRRRQCSCLGRANQIGLQDGPSTDRPASLLRCGCWVVNACMIRRRRPPSFFSVYFVQRHRGRVCSRDDDGI